MSTTLLQETSTHIGSIRYEREPLVLGEPTLHDITAKIAGIAEEKPSPKYLLALSFTAALAAWGIGCILYTILVGIGVWGLNNPIGWGWDITNFVFWIGIGHAGTLISAILFLFRQKWRTAINRSAEAMTIFAVICAGLFPLIHVGRIWFAYWLIPYPNQMQMWTNFRSPLEWDVFAVTTYLTVSLIFWFWEWCRTWQHCGMLSKTSLPKSCTAFSR